MGLLRRYREPIFVLILLVLPFVFYVSNAKSTRDHNAVDRVVVTISTPVQWLVVTVLDGVTRTWNRYIALMEVERDNERLRERMTELEAELRLREETLHENERLRSLVGLQERSPDVPMSFAEVIATSPTPLFRSVRIDLGENDGVAVGMPVITPDGVAGRVAAVAPGYSDVMLVADANSSLDVLVQRTRGRARVRGKGGDGTVELDVEHLARTADVEPGDILITSGTGDSFPKGLRVGMVTRVERGAYGLYQKAEVRPSVDFGRLESVMVLKGGWAEQTSFEMLPGPPGPAPGEVPSLLQAPSSQRDPLEGDGDTYEEAGELGDAGSLGVGEVPVP